MPNKDERVISILHKVNRNEMPIDAALSAIKQVYEGKDISDDPTSCRTCGRSFYEEPAVYQCPRCATSMEVDPKARVKAEPNVGLRVPDVIPPEPKCPFCKDTRQVIDTMDSTKMRYKDCPVCNPPKFMCPTCHRESEEGIIMPHDCPTPSESEVER